LLDDFLPTMKIIV